MKRVINQRLQAQDAMDGAGVKIRRVSTVRQKLADPFLLLDELQSNDPNDFIAGFPPHPHRGIETLTYIREGGIQHEDHMGNKGEVLSGGAQWMSAGRGVIHSEMPLRENNRLHGFQLWINLSAAQKMKHPDYRDIQASDIPDVTTPGYRARVLAGRWQLNKQFYEGPLASLAAEAAYLDLELNAEGHFSHAIPDDHQVVVYVYEGELSDAQPVKASTLLMYTGQGDLELRSESGAKMLILHGKPHREPIANYGPFVMNTMDEINQAIQDYQNGTLVDQFSGSKAP